MVELVGPLVDDGGAVGRTLARVLAGEGLELRPGAVDQVTGAAAGWAVATVMEGHGRSTDASRLAELEREVVAGWMELQRSGSVRARPGALEALHRAAGSAPVAVLTGLPEHVAAALLAQVGATGASITLIAAGGPDGLPRRDRLAAWLAGVPGDAPATAMLASAPAMLAAIGAGVATVVLVGEAGPAAMMLAERRVADLATALDG